MESLDKVGVAFVEVCDSFRSEFMEIVRAFGNVVGIYENIRSDSSFFKIESSVFRVVSDGEQIPIVELTFNESGKLSEVREVRREIALIDGQNRMLRGRSLFEIALSERGQ